ncbi:MAG: helix-turn-helix transcriptional regulator [Nitrospinaceae bacterium]
MADDQSSVSLPEKDYLAILEIIPRLHQCLTRKDLKKAFQALVLPLLDAQSGFTAWTDNDFTQPRIIDAVNIPDSDVKCINTYLSYDFVGKQIMSRCRPVMAFDRDHYRKETTGSIDLFFTENPQYKLGTSPYLKRIEGAIATIDLPDTNVGYAVHRLTPFVTPWTVRDIRVFELLRPHFLQSIKTIMLTEELTKFRSLAGELAESPTPIALVQENGQIFFSNRAFKEMVPWQSGPKLPKEIFQTIEREITKYDPPFDLTDAKIDIPFISLPQGDFRLHLVRLKDNTFGTPEPWLLRMKPALTPYFELNRLMQEAGLSGREMDICILIREGIDDREIADRLFISPNTVKNHVKSIHRKLGVQTRAQLVAQLNQ